MRRRTRAQALLIEQGRILMVRHFDVYIGQEYWCLPGGGVESGELPEQAVIRELAEETGLKCRIIKYIGRQELPGVTQGYAATETYAVEVIGGELALGYDPEQTEWRMKFLQEVRWRPLDGELISCLERYFFKGTNYYYNF
jgi:8-oxo-dGTP diphosphatase